MTVVVVEDNDDLRESVVDLLKAQALNVVSLSCAEDLDDTPNAQPASVYLVDLNLPGEDGLSLTRRIRGAQPHARIVLLTARKQIADRVAGYDSGADVYLPKPADPAELIAVVKALRKQALARFLDLPQLRVDSGRSVLVGPQGEQQISQSEVRLLSALATATDGFLECWQVASHLGIDGDDLNMASLRVRLSQLRKKLETVGATSPSLRAQRKAGYRLCVRIEIMS